MKKTMTPKAIQQRINAIRSRWAKPKNRRKRKGLTAKNLALLVAAATLIGSSAFIYIGESTPRPSYAVRVPGGIEIFP